MERAILKELTAKKGNPCITMVLSTDVKSFADRRKVELKLKNGLARISPLMEPNYDTDNVRKTVNDLKDLISNIDLNHLSMGLGIYYTRDFNKVVRFPFEINEKVVVADSFELSDIQENLDKMNPYSVLLLSKNSTRFFKGMGIELKEVKDDNFPVKFENEFQVHRTSPGSFYNEEESKLDHARVESFFRKVDRLMNSYGKDQNLILLGVTKHLSDFKSISKHGGHIIGTIKGNFDKHSLPEILKQVLPLIQNDLVDV